MCEVGGSEIAVLKRLTLFTGSISFMLCRTGSLHHFFFNKCDNTLSDKDAVRPEAGIQRNKHFLY